ncbi:lipopolysaccharide biosynthesis protein [Anaeromyxobacter oryzae]|nr:oligosaccharide flippase family protein [Anaeromyxobacter oryzae]
MLVGTIAYSAVQWIYFVILARWGGTTAVGTYAYALALTAPFMTFAALQLPALLATDVQGRYAFADYRTLSAWTSAGGVVGIVLLVSITGTAASSWSVLAPVCAMRVADLLADVYYGAWQRDERMRVIGVSRLVRAVSSAVLMTAAMLLGGGLAGAAVGAAIGSTAALAYAHARTYGDGEMRRRVAERTGPPSTRKLLALAAEAFPLGVILLLVALQANAPRYFVDLHAGRDALGIFAAASQLTGAGVPLITAIGSAAVPRFASLRAAGDTKAFDALVRKLVLLGAGLGAAGVAVSATVGRTVLAVVYRPEFTTGAGVLVILSVAAAAGFVAAFLGYAMTAARIIVVQPFILAVALAVLVAACAVLVPRHGAAGAAWGLVAASAFQCLASWAALRRSRAVARGAVA